MKSKARIDMTTGPMLANILRFLFPLILTNILQQLYHAADVMVVGLSSDPNAVGAVGSTGTYLGLIRNIFIGFSVGSGVVTARHIGAKDGEGTSRAVHTSICMGALFGVVGGCIGILLARPVMVAMGYGGTLLTLGLRYSYIYLACMPFLSLTNILSAILQAKGNTKTSFYVLSGTGVLNVLLNLFFVLVLQFSVSGVAIATAIANLTSAVVLWRYIAGKDDDCRIMLKRLRMWRAEFCDIARIGFPAGIQSALFSLSNLLIQSSILEVNNAVTPPNSAYDPVVKGVAAAAGIENLLFATTNAVNTTAATVVSQNVGKGDYRRVRRAFGEICLIATVLLLVMSFGFLLLREPLLALYGIKPSKDVLGQLAFGAAETRIFIKWTTFILYAILACGGGTLRGLGLSSTSAAISFVGTCVFRVAWIYTVFRALKSLESIFMSYPISWLLTGAVFVITVLAILKKRMNKKDEHLAE